MFVYHFAWDLKFYGFTGLDPSIDPAWRIASHAIASAFLFIAGFSLVVAQARAVPAISQVRRLAVVGLAAAVISLATWIAFPDAFIFAGILHCIFATCVIGLALTRAPSALIAVFAAAAFAAPVHFASHEFDGPALWWLGLNEGNPRTLDYRPLLPWLGVTLTGLLAGRLARHFDPAFAFLRWRAPSRPAQALALGGRHSLLVYLGHQPLFLAALFIAAKIISPQSFSPQCFVSACQAQCIKAGAAAERCEEACACVVDGLKASNLWRDTLANQLDDAGRRRMSLIASQCR